MITSIVVLLLATAARVLRRPPSHCTYRSEVAVKRVAILLGVCLLAALTVPAAGQAPEASQGPTPKNPLRLTAFGISMQTGIKGTIDVVIERWTTDQEREALLKLAAKSKADFRSGQEELINALQDIKPRTGFIRVPSRLGWDLKYARENALPDGTRQIVVVTDKPVSFFAARNNTRTMDYPFTLIEIRLNKENKGEGRMLAQTSIAVNNGRLELENYGQEPVRLTTVSERK